MELKPGFKQTEVGGIPEAWKTNSVSNLAKIKTGPFGTLLKASEYSDSEGVPIISVGEIGAGRFKVTTHTPLAPNSVVRRLPQYILRTGDVVFARKGAVQRSALVTETEDGWFLGSDGIAIRPHDGCHPPYLAAQFQGHALQSWLSQNATGTTMASLNQEILGRVQVPIAPLGEQCAIATALSDVDALIAKLDQLIAKKRDIKQAAMQQLLTGRTRLPGFSGEWDVRQLGDLATFHKGKGLPKNALSIDGSEPCVHYGELFTQYGATISETISRTNKTPNQFRSVANDVLMPTSDVTPRGLAKASCVLFDDLVLGGDILVIRPDSTQISGAFLSRLIRFEDEQVLRLVTGSTVYHLYAADMKKFALRLPSLSEQHAITVALSDMDAEIDALEARCYKTKALKQGMMQALLTGQVRLPIGTELMEALA